MPGRVLVGGLTAFLLAGCGIDFDWGESEPGPGTNAAGGAAVADGQSATESPEPAMDILGLNREAVRGLLGPPRRLRRDSPAEVWQYLTEACVVDLFLYEEAGGYKVTFYESRTLTADNTEPAPCLAAVRSRFENAG